LEQVEEQLEFLASRDIRSCSLLVVPDFHHEGSLKLNRSFCETVSRWQRAGHEIVLHGFFHDRLGSPRESWQNLFWTRLYSNREAEFLDLPLAEARRRLRTGRALFQEQGWDPQGFVAPAWLMAEGLITLLAEEGFAYTTRLQEIIPLRRDGPNRIVSSQSLCYSCRASWRRACSGLWNKYLFGRLRQTSLVRLSLHPLDLHFPLLRRQIDQIARACLKAQFTPSTYLGYVMR
jgi:predicted deacetylase